MTLYMPKPKGAWWFICLTFILPFITRAQEQANETLPSATLDEVIQYALVHQPAVRQAQIDQEITNQAIKGKLADWYPQINFNYTYQRFIDLQTSVIGGNTIRFGVNNTSSAQFTATQNIFNRDALLASSTASTVRIQAEQNTQRSKIDMVVDVSKAFYDVLATMQQIKVSEESVIRLRQSFKDAKSRYNAGISDKTDYQRATILLSNAIATHKSNVELLKFKEQNLKTLMGYPNHAELPIAYDVEEMEEQILIDTLQELNYQNHIEYRLLMTKKEIQHANVKYNQWAFLPSVNLFGAYNLNYQNNNISELYSTSYPYSYVGATISFPLFKGGKRIAGLQEQKWASSRLDVSIYDLENRLSSEYTRALSAYKSNLYNYLTLKENVSLAEDVYDVIRLQYQNGVKSYLEVTIAESDLNTTKINYFNALYQVLASKLEIQRALGQINY